MGRITVGKTVAGLETDRNTVQIIKRTNSLKPTLHCSECIHNARNRGGQSQHHSFTYSDSTSAHSTAVLDHPQWPHCIVLNTVVLPATALLTQLGVALLFVAWSTNTIQLYCPRQRCLHNWCNAVWKERISGLLKDISSAERWLQRLRHCSIYLQIRACREWPQAHYKLYHPRQRDTTFISPLFHCIWCINVDVLMYYLAYCKSLWIKSVC